MDVKLGAPDAVIFDLDGVLVDSEQVWEEVRERFVRERGGRWQERAQRDMMGMSSTEWSRYVREELGVPVPAEEISTEVSRRVAGRYRRKLPLLPGAREAVRRLAARWPLGLASSSNRPIIDLVLEGAGVAGEVAGTRSPACRTRRHWPRRWGGAGTARGLAAPSPPEEVGGAKPAPDVYLEAASR